MIDEDKPMERKFFLGNQVVFDTLKGEISSDLKSVGLGSRDAAILKLLCEQRNKVVQKEDIHQHVWGKVLVSETSLTKAISNLRKSLSLFEELTCQIKTIPKEGYVLIQEDDVSDSFWLDELSTFDIKNVINGKATNNNDFLYIPKDERDLFFSKYEEKNFPENKFFFFYSVSVVILIFASIFLFFYWGTVF